MHSSQNYGASNFPMVSSHKNYYFKDALAYTEDHILVKMLILYNVAQELSPQRVLTYFKNYGTVVKFRLNPVPNYGGGRANMRRPITKTGFILFTDPRGAAKVLERTVHFIGGRRLSVKPNYSWNQPDAYGDDQVDDQVAPIMKLNDHCLEHIVRQLCLSDRIHFGRTCIRFRHVYLQLAPSLDKSVNIDVFDEMTVWDMRDFFMLSGCFVKEIKGVIPQRHCLRLCEFIGANCINLKSLDIQVTKLTSSNMYKIFSKLNQLEDLKLRGCDLENNTLTALKKLLQLKQLDISNNEKLTGANMHLLPATIESLALTNCTKLKSTLLPQICRALPNLKELNIKGIYKICSGFQTLISEKCCNSLESLTVSCGSGQNSGYEHIAMLPSLKKLTMHSYQAVKFLRPELINRLVEHRSQQLQHFEVRGENRLSSALIFQLSNMTALRTLILPNNEAVGDRELEALGALQELEEINIKYCSNVSETAVTRLILACPKLKLLHLEECVQLTDKLITDLIFKFRLQVRQRESHRFLPIKLNVHGTNINEYTLLNSDVAAKDILDVSLAAPSASELCFVNMLNLFELELDEYDSFESDEDHEQFLFDQYMFEMGFMSDDDGYDLDDDSDCDMVGYYMHQFDNEFANLEDSGDEVID